MAIVGTFFQYSNQVKLDRTVQEKWTNEQGLDDFALMDSIGNRSRVLRVKIVNPLNIKETFYRPMLRVRLLDDYGVTTFLGRIVSIDPDYDTGHLVLTCRDFLDDIADRTITASQSDGDYTAINTNRMLDLILYYETIQPSGAGTTSFGIDRALAWRLQTTASSYTEYKRRTYGIKGDYQTSANDVTSDYLYRGTKTGMEVFTSLAEEDVQQDFMVMYYHPAPTNHGGEAVHSNIDPSTYWTDLTWESREGTYYIKGLSISAGNTDTPQSGDIFYFGSNSKFDGIGYTYLTQGQTLYDGAYTLLRWQYWDGDSWVNFTPTADNRFIKVTGSLEGSATWTVSNLSNWGKRDLGATPDMHTANDANQSWSPPYDSSGSTTLPSDVRSVALSKVHHGGQHRNTNRYWVRVYCRDGNAGDEITDKAYFNRIKLFTMPSLSHDYRVAHPDFFSEVWKYTHNTAGTGWATGREGHGGTWLALNMSGGNAGTGTKLLWDTNDGTTNFIGGATETWYFGAEKAFNGVSFHALQREIPDYSNVKFVWQTYSNYYATTENEPWQTISGLTISGNTVANPTGITTERHHLSTGSSVTISGSNSTPTINGTHTVTVINATTFSIPVNVTTAGTAGHVVCNNHISATEALSGSGNAAWQEDEKQEELTPHWYLDVRWDSEKILHSIDNEKTIPEFEDIRFFSTSTYRDLVSLSSPSASKNGPSSTGLNSILPDGSNPTVIITSATPGGTSANHNMQTGDKILISQSNSTPSIDGIHTVTRGTAGALSIPVVNTSSGNTAVAQAITPPPNDKYLYWARCYIASGTPTRVATLRDVKTSANAILEYFDRGSTPWLNNAPATVNASIANTVFPYCYRYDTSASAGSKFTDYSQEIQSSTSGTSFTISGNTVANPTVVTTTGVGLTIRANSVATPTLVTTTTAHGLVMGDSVVITGSNSTPSINGTHVITPATDRSFEINVTVTGAGSAGTVTPVKAHGLTTGHKVVITGSNSTPTLNGTHAVTVLSTTTFSVAVNVTGAGTAGTVVPEKVYAVDNGQAGDAIYFGSDDPFTQIRLNLSDVLTSSSTGRNDVTWEYFRGESLSGSTWSETNDWVALSVTDSTANLRTSGTNTIIFDMPDSWRPIQPGIKESNATDQSFGKTAYYVRAKLGSNQGSPATSAAKIVQGWFGPNLWSTNLEVGTISGVTSTRHSNPQSHGLTLSEREQHGPQRMPIAGYELRDHPTEFVNKIAVRGINGSYGVAEDTSSQTTYGVIKERIIDDSSLTSSAQCYQRALSLLEKVKSTATTTIRECRIRLPAPPIYTYLNEPKMVRAGDRVNVDIPTAGVSNESWLLYSMTCNVSGGGWMTELLLFRDISTVFEPGPADRRVLRDVVSRSRETANAAFQPVDKAVQGSLSFLPQGPGRGTLKLEYDDVGTGLDIYNTGGSTEANWTNEWRLNIKNYSDFDTGLMWADPILRIDQLGVTPERRASASGGGGVTFIGRDKRTSGGTPDFHPGPDEATLYLRDSATASEGSGLYIAHRNIFNSGTTYDEGGTDTPKLNAEVMTGFTGFVSHNDISSTGRFTINLPALDSAPLVFANICGAEGGSDSSKRYPNAICIVRDWTVASSKYTAVEMAVMGLPNDNYTYTGFYTITAISAANPTVITTTGNMPNGRPIWIGNSNSTPSIDGLYTVSNKSGSSPYTYTLTALPNTSFPVNVTGAGTDGKIMSMGHIHSMEDTAQYYDTSVMNPAGYGIGIMYMVIFNSGKNTTGLNSHFSQNHVSHP